MPIRWRITAVSTVGMLLLLGAAGLIFLTTLKSGLENTLDNSLRSRADEVTAQVSTAGALLPTAPGGKLTLSDDGYGQVLRPDGSVLLTSDSRLSTALISTSRVTSGRTGTHLFDVRGVPVVPRGQAFRVLTEPLGSAGLVIVVGTSRDVADQPVETAGKQLLVVGAVVFLVAAAGSWLLARSALRPVEKMRRQAARLQAADASGGVDVPTTRDELSRLGSTLNELLARLHSALERERAFVADAGHELRTPLTVLRGELELARRPGRTHAELVETVAVASEETERLIRLAESLLVLARDEGADDLDLEQFDVLTMLREAAAMVATVAASRSITIAVTGPEQLVARGDLGRLRQAVDNLLSNALGFAPTGSTIDVEVSRDAGDVQIVVSDTGPGIPDELLPVLFERFRRGDSARTRRSVPGGTGLGLAIARSALRSHGGDAHAANRAQRTGAVLTLRWPSPPADDIR